MIVNRQRNQSYPERGDIYLLRLGVDGLGGRIRQPVLVIQNDIGNRFCSTVIVVPLYPNMELKGLMLGVLVAAGGTNGLAKDHVALLTQIRTIDRVLVGPDNFVGRPDPTTLRKIDEAIRLSLGLSTVQKIQNNQRRLHWKRLWRGDQAG